jgi:hypothetical protein
VAQRLSLRRLAITPIAMMSVIATSVAGAREDAPPRRTRAY